MENLRQFDKAISLGKFWHEKKGSLPKNLKERIKFAINLSERNMPNQHRKTISLLIRELASHGLENFMNYEDLDMLLISFEKGDITLAEIFNYELEQIENDKDEMTDEIKQRLGDINQTIYNVLKGTLDGDLRADALTSLDLVIDDNRNQDFETALKAIFGQIEKNLSQLANLKEVSLAHVNPDPDIPECIVYTNLNPEKRLGLSGDVDLDNLKWQKAQYSNLIVTWAKVSLSEENENRIIFKLNFGEQEFGYLEYKFDGESVHQIAFDTCANMSAMMDTFLNARLQIEIKKLIESRKREILADNKLKDWRLMCTELCKVLSKVLQTPISFSCDLKPGGETSWDILIDGATAKEEVNLARFTKEALESGGEFFNLQIDEGKGRQIIGSLMVACKDDAQRGIVNDALSFLEGIIMGREEARHWLSKLIGAPAADKYLEDNIELTPTDHPVVTLFSDIDDYSRTVRELSAEKAGIDKIMSEFIARAKKKIEKDYDVIIDKFVGDEAIVLIGPPYDKEGLDMFGNKEPNYAQYIDLAYDIANKLQLILNEISEEFQKRDGFKLPRRLVFANGCGIVDGDPVGIYGKPEEPGAGVDYTIFGNEMNRVARVLGEADAYEFLMPYDSYLKYVEAGGKKLQPVKDAFEVETHGVGKFKVILVSDVSAPLDKE